jgi:hypothetical protein
MKEYTSIYEEKQDERTEKVTVTFLNAVPF